MIRIITTILALTTFILAITSFVKDKKADNLPHRISSFFLLILSVVLCFFVAMDVYSTVQLLFEYYLGKMGIMEPPVYPGSAPLCGIKEHGLWYNILLDFMCAMTLFGVIKRKKIPGIVARD